MNQVRDVITEIDDDGSNTISAYEFYKKMVEILQLSKLEEFSDRSEQGASQNVKDKTAYIKLLNMLKYPKDVDGRF
jgi:hypothetical protein